MKRKLAVLLTAAMFCETMFTQGLAGIGSGLFQVQAEAVNVALNKEATASSTENASKWQADKAVDGDSSSADSRWSSGKMRPAGTTDEAEQTPQWLMLDLLAKETQVESIKIIYHLKVWSTKYRIQTSDTKDGEWTDVYVQGQRSSSDDNNVTDNISAESMESTTLKRYVRFYFEKLNVNAGGTGISIKEIEILGTQTDVIEKELSAEEALNQITELPVSISDKTLSIPEISENMDISVYGSEVAQVLSDEGEISPYHIGNRSMNVILKAVNKNDSTDVAKKSITVTVPGNESLYPDLFPEVKNPNAEPEVLPTIQEWYGYEGNFTLTENSKIIVNDVAGLGIMDTAKEMQEDLKEICGWTIEIQEGTAPSAGNIYLESQEDDIYGTGEEGYFIVNGENGIEIYSSAKNGMLYGTVTLEQILYQDEDHKDIPKGVIRDYPLYEVRGIMFDVARIPTRVQFLKDYTKILKWYKLNEMSMHLNDNQWSSPEYSPKYEEWKEVEASHRLESDLFPSLATQKSKFQGVRDEEGRYDYYYNEYTGKDGELYYTKEEYAELQKLAEERGICMIAELDTPSHSAAYSKYVYENQEEVITSLVENNYLEEEDYLTATGELQDGVTFYINNPNNFELLSIDDKSTDETEKTNAENAKIFMTALFDEYLGGENPLFTTDVISAGVDEYWDKGTTAKKEAFRRYMNFMQELLGEKYGKEVRMWGSLKQFTGTTEVSKDIVLEVWNVGTEEEPLQRIEEGYKVINVPQPYLYTTPGRYHKDMIREEYIYNNWEPEMFSASVVAEKGEPLFLGAKAALWGDENREGITEADLNERYLRLAAMVSEKTWGGTKEEDTFLTYEQTFDALREGPGTQIANEISSVTNVVLDYDFENVSTDGKTVYDQSGNGYDGTIEGGEVVEKDGETFMKFDGDTTITTPLTTLGYPYTMSFDVYLDGTEENTKESSLFSGYDGRLQIAGLNGELSLNRDYFTQSFGYTQENLVKHRITIVGTYQVTKLYVDGEFKKILYAAASDSDNGGSISASSWQDADDNYRTTFVFPLETIGKNFSGYLANIKAYNKALSTEELQAEGFIGTGEADVARNVNAYTESGNTAFWDDQMRLYPAWKATDGDGHVTGAEGVSVSNESRWNSSDTNTDYLMVDLGEEKAISKVVIDWEASRYGASYNIEVSTDGKTWKTVKEVTGNSSAYTVDEFEEVVARYVKMQGVLRKSGSNEYSIYEMKVYASVDKTDLYKACQETASLLEEKEINWESTGERAEVFQMYLQAKAVCSDVLAGKEEIQEAQLLLSSISGEIDNFTKTFSVSLNANGGQIASGNITSYTQGTEVQLPTDVSREHYIFAGWYSDEKLTEKVSVISAEAEGDLTFYAKWIPESYKITYNLNGGTNNAKNVTSYTVENEVSLYNPSRTGYTFAGWYSDKNCTKAVTSIAKGSSGDKTLYAKWQAVSYKISYNLNGGTNNAKNVTSYTVENEVSLYNPSRTGYSFAGWYSDEKCTKKVTAITKGSSGDKTLYAKWKVVSYKITYQLNGGTNNKKNATSYTIENGVSLYSPSRTGYKFAGWYSDKKCTKKVTAITKGSIGNQTLYAKWLLSYKITYKLNGGTNNKKNVASYTVAKKVSLYSPSRKGYKFVGWYSDKKCTKKVTAITKGSIGNKTLYAKWQAVSYKITYKLNGGTNSKKNVASYTIAKKVKLYNPSRTGYKFVGWYSDKKCTKKVTAITKGSIGKKTLYAKWRKK